MALTVAGRLRRRSVLAISFVLFFRSSIPICSRRCFSFACGPSGTEIARLPTMTSPACMFRPAGRLWQPNNPYPHRPALGAQSIFVRHPRTWRYPNLRSIMTASQGILGPMPKDIDHDSHAIDDATLAQEIRKGGVGHNPAVQGGIVVANPAGELSIQPVSSQPDSAPPQAPIAVPPPAAQQQAESPSE